MTPHPQGDTPRLATLAKLLQQLQDIVSLSISKLHQATLHPETYPDGDPDLSDLQWKPAKLKDFATLIATLASAMPSDTQADTTFDDALFAVDTLSDDELIEALLRLLDPMLDAGLTLLEAQRDAWPTPLAYSLSATHSQSNTLQHDA
jgi:hypothetical protein